MHCCCPLCVGASQAVTLMATASCHAYGNWRSRGLLLLTRRVTGEFLLSRWYSAHGHGLLVNCHAHSAGARARAAAQLAARLSIVVRRAEALEAALLWFDKHHPGLLHPFVLLKVRASACSLLVR